MWKVHRTSSWRLSPSATILVTIFVLCNFVHCVTALGRFIVSINALKNYRHARMDGTCCNTGLPMQSSDAACLPECVTMFKVCLREFDNLDIPDQPYPYTGKCSFGNMTTPHIGMSSFRYNRPPQVSLNINFKWTRSFTLIIEVYDGAPVNKHIIDRVIYKGVLAPGDKGHKLVQVTKRGVEFDYILEMKCDKNYYNVTCSKYCSPRDDVHGHYDCNRENGEKICKIGWRGQDCNEPICKLGCHNVHGSCDRPGECKCEAGWQGAYCTECIKYPGCKHGSCNNSPWSCKCFLNWGGRFCEKDLNYCGRQRPCKNNGICLTEDPETSQSLYRCICPLGFNGTNCENEQPACSAKPCQNGGICTEQDRTYGKPYSCECPKGFKGDNCQENINACKSNPCENGATCLDLRGDKYKCICKKGFKGQICNVPTNCDGSYCVNGVDCTDKERNQAKCECQIGWEGERCDKNIDDCKGGKKCKNGGTCVDLINEFYCKCPLGFRGRHCEIDIDECLEKPCKNGGICRDQPGKYICECPKDFFGKRCEIDRTPCDPNPCLHGAYCYNMGVDYYCKCIGNFHGKRCELMKPSCNHNGICEVVDPCSLPPPLVTSNNKSHSGVQSSTVCGHHGRCVSMGYGNFKCECDPGFEGELCEKNINECEHNPCLNGGTCLDGANSFQCLCTEGFLGKLCEVNRNECYPNPCQNGGLCEDLSNDFKCKCLSGWKGRWCHLRKKPCQTPTCMNDGQCYEEPLSEDGIQCSCTAKWHGTQCHIRYRKFEPCWEGQTPKCHNGGTCVNIGASSYTCICTDGYTGKSCESRTNKCTPNPCFNNGSCTDYTTTYKCDCQRGFAGPDCRINLDDCASSPCAYGASCVDQIGGYTCGCPDGRNGSQCEFVIGKTMPKPPSCIFRRRIYDHGDKWTMNCNNCTCNKGRVVCVGDGCEFKSCLDDQAYCKPGTHCVMKSVLPDRCFVHPCHTKHICENKTEEFERIPWASRTDPNCRPNSSAMNNRCANVRITYDRYLLPYGVTVDDICQSIRNLRVVRNLRGRYTISITCEINQYNPNVIEVAVSSTSETRNAFRTEDLEDDVRLRPLAHQLADLIGAAIRAQESPDIWLKNALTVHVETLLVNSENWGPSYLMPLLCVLVTIAVMSIIPIVLYHIREKRRIKMKYAPLQRANNIQGDETAQQIQVTRNLLPRSRKDERRPLKGPGDRGIEISAPITHGPIAIPGTSNDSGCGTYSANQGPSKQYIYGARRSGPPKDVNVAQRASGEYDRGSPLVV